MKPQQIHLNKSDASTLMSEFQIPSTNSLLAKLRHHKSLEIQKKSLSARQSLKLPQIFIGNGVQTLSQKLTNQVQSPTFRKILVSPKSIIKKLFNQEKPMITYKKQTSIVLKLPKIQSLGRSSERTQINLQRKYLSPQNHDSLYRNKTEVYVDKDEKKVLPKVNQPLENVDQPKEVTIMVSDSSSKGTSQITDEFHSIWDNRDLRLRGMDVLDKQAVEQVEQFLTLFKMRYAAFPDQKEAIQNEEVIKYAINLARVNKKIFKKYFPTNQVMFEDNNDYNQEYDLANDPNFQKFVEFTKHYHKKNKFAKQNKRSSGIKQDEDIVRLRQKTHV